MNLKQQMYEIAKGDIENPEIEIESEGETMSFSGRDARIFATGVLLGIKSTIDKVSIDRNITAVPEV